MAKKIGKFVVGSILAGGVASTASRSLGVTQGSTMTADMMKGSAMAVKPAAKIKGASLILGNVRKLQKKTKKLTN